MSRKKTRSSGLRRGVPEHVIRNRRLADAARRRERVRRRGRWCLAFAVLAACAALLLPTAVYSDYAEETAFDRAAPCAPDAPAGFRDCLSRSSDIVVSKRETTGKGAHAYVSFDAGGPTPVEIGFPAGAFYNRLAVGETIGVTVWRQHVVRLDDALGSTETDDSPTGNTQLALTFALFTLGAAVWLGYLSFWYLRRTERSAAVPAPPALILPARVLSAAAAPLLVAFVALLGTRESLSPATALLVTPLSCAGVLLLAASSLLSPWTRRPGEVHLKPGDLRVPARAVR